MRIGTFESEKQLYLLLSYLLRILLLLHEDFLN